MRRRYLLLLAPALLWGCNEDPVATQREPCVQFLQSYGVVSGDTVTTPEGVRYIDIEPGTGPQITWGNLAQVDFSGYFASGTRFDSSCETDGRSVVFQLGDPNYPAGFQYGIIGMRLAGTRRIILSLEFGLEGDTEERVIDVHLLNLLN